MPRGSPQPSSREVGRASGRRGDRPGLFDVVRVRRPVPEHGIQAGDQGTVVEVLTNPAGYLVDFSGEPGYDAHELPVYGLTREQIDVVSHAIAPVP